MFVYFVGPPYYSQRAVFASPLSAFFIHVCDLQKFVKSVQNGMLLNDHEDSFDYASLACIITKCFLKDCDIFLCYLHVAIKLFT